MALHPSAAANSINSPFLDGYLTGVPSQSFRPIGTATSGTAPTADSLITLPDPALGGSRRPDYTSELELLYIQREKELLDKLADTMTKVRVYEDDGLAPSPLNSQKKRRSNRWRGGLNSAGPADPFAAQAAPGAAPGDRGAAEDAPPSPPRSPKRSSKLGLHQPTASSLAKNEGQILKKVRKGRGFALGRGRSCKIRS